uniref:Astacin domain-containing protein n=1 Tax=Parastrongyloides trichosuri TaxID=131310 RepID=A0A0N5A4H3_PARTI
MLFINLVSFIFLISCFIVRVDTRRLPQSRSIDVPYLFTGITVCNGSRLANVKLGLWTKRGIFYTSVLLSKNHSDPYGVFTLKTYVPSNLQKELQLCFRYNCDVNDHRRNPHKKEYCKYVSSFRCLWDGATKGIKCKLLAELQDKTVGHVHYPSVSLLTIKKKQKYEIKKWNVNSNISYFIENDFENSTEVKKQIKFAIEEIQNNTCIKFENKEQIIQNKSGINFIKSHK